MMTVRWLLLFPLSIALTFFAWIIAPVLALRPLVTVINGREWLISPLRYFQTHDAPVDEWRFGGYWKSCDWLPWQFNKSRHRYLARYFWLCRNPVYGFNHYVFGIVPKLLPAVTGSTAKWDTGLSNWEYTDWGNAFNFRAQWFFYGAHYLRINIGWKSHKGFNRLMLATHISPFRKWK
jgi:hypothetical protein